MHRTANAQPTTSMPAQRTTCSTARSKHASTAHIALPAQQLAPKPLHNTLSDERQQAQDLLLQLQEEVLQLLLHLLHSHELL